MQAKLETERQCKLFMHMFDVPQPTFCCKQGFWVYCCLLVVDALRGMALNSWHATIRDPR